MTSVFIPTLFRMLTDVGRLRANVGPFVSLPCKMRANILIRGILPIISSCAMDLMFANLAFAKARETD